MNTEIAVSESTSLMDRIAAVLKGVASSETIGAMIAEAEAEVRRLSNEREATRKLSLDPSR